MKQHQKDDMQMANKHRKKCSTPLTIRKMHIKTTLRYYFTPIRIERRGRKKEGKKRE